MLKVSGGKINCYNRYVFELSPVTTPPSLQISDLQAPGKNPASCGQHLTYKLVKINQDNTSCVSNKKKLYI
jgi:hypothetical protein